MKKSLYLKRLELIDNRMGLDPQGKRELQNLNRGYQGEKYVYDLLQSYSFKNWVILSGIDLRTSMGYVQIDFLLLNGKDIYIFEVKNYNFSCVLQNNRWFFDNQKPLGTNISHQVQMAKLHLQRIFENESQPPVIHPCILFVHPEHPPKILGQPEEIILTAYQIEMFLLDIPANHYPHITEKQHKRILSYLHKNAEMFFMRDKKLDHGIEKGVYCASCRQFTLRQVYRSVVCESCDACESKKKCVIRLTDEYCILSLKETIAAYEIANFSQNFFTRQQIGNQMSQYLKKCKKGRYTTYQNPLFNS